MNSKTEETILNPLPDLPSLKIQDSILSVIREESNFTAEVTQETLNLEAGSKLKVTNEESSSSSSSSTSSDEDKKQKIKIQHEENEKTESPPPKKRSKKSVPKKEHIRRKNNEGENNSLTYDRKFKKK